jgi:phosphatidylserine decarboxylase
MQSSTKEAPLPWYARPYVDLQRLLPQHLLSSLMHKITRSRWTPLKDLLIRKVVDFYKVDMSQAVQPDLKAYDSFNAFFTRELKPEARPLADAQDAILCPADGALSQAGTIQDGRLLQAKGRDFSLLELLGGDAQWAQAFAGGKFATVYLSPRDYHRVHMPLGGELRKMLHIPGRLFSVNPTTTRLVPSLFARNERVVCLFDTAAGPMAIILVGAIFVASIDTVWAGAVAPASRRVATWHYGEQLAKPIELARGQEMGRFNMGSTVILLYGPEQMDWLDTLQPGTELRMGAQIGRYQADGATE